RRAARAPLALVPRNHVAVAVDEHRWRTGILSSFGKQDWRSTGHRIGPQRPFEAEMRDRRPDLVAQIALEVRPPLAVRALGGNRDAASQFGQEAARVEPRCRTIERRSARSTGIGNSHDLEAVITP